MYTNTGCTRLVDYYFVVTASERGIKHTKDKLKGKSLAPANEGQPRHALFALKPKIVDRYPDIEHTGTPLLSWVARTSMPRGVRARTRPPPPRFFTFIGWNTDGSKLYGACLEVFEKITIPNQKQNVYIPKTLGFLSHYPYFCAFDVFLRCLWHVIPKKLITLEDLLVHYFYDIPAPGPARKIAYDLGQMKVLLACRNKFDVPILELPMETTFTQLSKDRICFILKLLLLENRVIFICSNVHELTPVCELFISLLFPLRWRHLYIPIISKQMFEALMSDHNKHNNNDHINRASTAHFNSQKHRSSQSRSGHGNGGGGGNGGKHHHRNFKYNENLPFLVGLPRFVYIRPEIQNNMPKNAFLVFLDKNEIRNYKKRIITPSEMKSGHYVPNLPQPLEDNLTDAVHSLARILTMQVDAGGGVGHNPGHFMQQPNQRNRSHQRQNPSQNPHTTSNNAQVKGSSGNSPQGTHSSHTNGNHKPPMLGSQVRHTQGNTSASSAGSNTTTSSSMTIGGHNSSFISREYTLQAFRTMFAVMTKLLYLSAHENFGNINDKKAIKDSKLKPKVDRAAKAAKCKFIVLFRDTSLFDSFYKYYQRINGNKDPHVKRLYLFFKEHEGHGKHFARRAPNTYDDGKFDRRLYDRETFRINKEKIAELEKRAGKNNKMTKLNIAAKRSKKYAFPIPEFEMLQDASNFLKIFVWREMKKRSQLPRYHTFHGNPGANGHGAGGGARHMDDQSYSINGSAYNKSEGHVYTNKRDNSGYNSGMSSRNGRNNKIDYDMQSQRSYGSGVSGHSSRKHKRHASRHSNRSKKSLKVRTKSKRHVNGNHKQFRANSPGVSEGNDVGSVSVKGSIKGHEGGDSGGDSVNSALMSGNPNKKKSKVVLPSNAHTKKIKKRASKKALSRHSSKTSSGSGSFRSKLPQKIVLRRRHQKELSESLEVFFNKFNDSKEDTDRQLQLCIEIERVVAMKNNSKNSCSGSINGNKAGPMNDVNAIPSIDEHAKKVGIKNVGGQTELQKESEAFAMDELRQIICDKGNKDLWVDTVHKMTDKYSKHKKNFSFIRSVVSMFDDELSLGTMSINSSFMGKSRDDVDSEKESNSSDETDESGSTDDSGSGSTDSSSSGSDDDDDEDEDTDTESTDSWGTDEFGGDMPMDDDPISHQKFQMLDEFEMHEKQNEGFQRSEQRHNDLIGYLDDDYDDEKIVDVNDFVAQDFMNQDLMSEFSKAYRKKMKAKRNSKRNANDR